VSRPSAKRAEIMAAMERATKTLSAQNLAVSQAIAERLGINVSDLECLTLARFAGDEGVTAGDLAAATALTSGAITGVIDRLERAGLVRRDRDASDRRKVIVRPTACVEKTVPPLFEPLHRSMTAMWTSYSDEHLELILDFLMKCRDLLRAEGVALRTAQRSDAPAVAKKSQARRHAA
jgi:DNA-binding MarR family transcriptional regulator